nr:uncharacterized protein LOC127349134 [Lolium perenne]
MQEQPQAVNNARALQVASEAKPGEKLGRWNKSPNQRVQENMARLLLPVFLCLVSAPFLATSPTASTHTCQLDLISLAVVSCQDSPQSPTPSCCDALLYAVDLFPSFELDRGICCLCKFMMTRAIPFDLPSVYRSCHGKDASMVGAWPMPTPSLGDCSGPCYEDVPAPPVPPGRSDGSKKPVNTLGSGAIIAIAVGAVVVGLLIVYCLCKKHRGGKARESPRPRDVDSSQGTGLEMGRISSSRNLL